MSGFVTHQNAYHMLFKLATGVFFMYVKMQLAYNHGLPLEFDETLNNNERGLE